MASKLKHIGASIFVGVVTSGMVVVLTKLPILFALPITLVFALLGGLVPDWLEPPVDALHRKFWHSKTMLIVTVALGLFTLMFAMIYSFTLYPLLRTQASVVEVSLFDSLLLSAISFVSVFMFSWAFHLYLDSETDMGIPIITGGRNPKRFAKNKEEWGI